MAKNETKSVESVAPSAPSRDEVKKALSARRAELMAQIGELDKKEEEIHQEELQERRELARKKIDYLREHRDFVLSLIKHDRSSCSDDHVVNGYGYGSDGHERARCRKCFLIELLNGEWGDDFDVDVSVDITPIE